MCLQPLKASLEESQRECPAQDYHIDHKKLEHTPQAAAGYKDPRSGKRNVSEYYYIHSFKSTPRSDGRSDYSPVPSRKN